MFQISVKFSLFICKSLLSTYKPRFNLARKRGERFCYQLAATLEQADQTLGLRETLVSDYESELSIQREEGRKMDPPASTPGWSKQLCSSEHQGPEFLDWGWHYPGDRPVVHPQ